MSNSGDMLARHRLRYAFVRTAMFCAIVAAATLPPTAAAQVSKNNFAEIATTVEGRIYTYHITNRGTRPIVRFEVPLYKVYNHEVPEGWDIQDSDERFGSKADSIEHAIGPGETKVFSCRAASMMTVASSVTAKIGLDDDQTIEMPGVWAPKSEKWSTILIPPVIISVLAIGYAIRTRSKTRRAAEAPDPS